MGGAQCCFSERKRSLLLYICENHVHSARPMKTRWSPWLKNEEMKKRKKLYFSAVEKVFVSVLWLPGLVTVKLGFRLPSVVWWHSLQESKLMSPRRATGNKKTGTHNVFHSVSTRWLFLGARSMVNKFLFSVWYFFSTPRPSNVVSQILYRCDHFAWTRCML